MWGCEGFAAGGCGMVADGSRRVMWMGLWREGSWRGCRGLWMVVEGYGGLWRCCGMAVGRFAHNECHQDTSAPPLGPVRDGHAMSRVKARGESAGGQATLPPPRYPRSTARTLSRGLGCTPIK